MTEHEINALMLDTEIYKSVLQLKKEFTEKEAKFLNIKDNDFLALIFMTPSIALANVDENISINEEMELSKKARRLSQGRYFFETDPVIQSMKYLIKDFNSWQDKFYSLIRFIINKYCFGVLESKKDEKVVMTENYKSFLLLSSPYLMVRFLDSVFLKGNEDIFGKQKLSELEFNKMLEIAEKLNIRHIPIFEAFLLRLK